jgi:hypothetical protein
MKKLDFVSESANSVFKARFGEIVAFMERSAGH